MSPELPSAVYGVHARAGKQTPDGEMWASNAAASQGQPMAGSFRPLHCFPKRTRLCQRFPPDSKPLCPLPRRSGSTSCQARRFLREDNGLAWGKPGGSIRGASTRHNCSSLETCSGNTLGHLPPWEGRTCPSAAHQARGCKYMTARVCRKARLSRPISCSSPWQATTARILSPRPRSPRSPARLYTAPSLARVQTAARSVDRSPCLACGRLAT